MDPGNESGNAVCVGQSCHMQTVVETWFCTCAGQVQPLRISGARFQVVWKTLVSSIIDKDPPIGLSIVSAGVVGQWQVIIIELLVDPGTFSCWMEPERQTDRDRGRERKRGWGGKGRETSMSVRSPWYKWQRQLKFHSLVDKEGCYFAYFVTLTRSNNHKQHEACKNCSFREVRGVLREGTYTTIVCPSIQYVCWGFCTVFHSAVHITRIT